MAHGKWHSSTSIQWPRSIIPTSSLSLKVPFGHAYQSQQLPFLVPQTLLEEPLIHSLINFLVNCREHKSFLRPEPADLWLAPVPRYRSASALDPSTSNSTFFLSWSCFFSCGTILSFFCWRSSNPTSNPSDDPVPTPADPFSDQLEVPRTAEDPYTDPASTTFWDMPVSHWELLLQRHNPKAASSL